MTAPTLADGAKVSRLTPRKTGTFTRFAGLTASASAHPYSFGAACAVVFMWGVSGPVFGYSDTWQLVINTGTTIVTFLMVFLIQNTQNRDTMALQLKLDEVIRSLEGAHNVLLDLEELTEDDLKAIKRRYLEIARRARVDLEEGKPDTAACEVPLGEDLADAMPEKGKDDPRP